MAGVELAQVLDVPGVGDRDAVLRLEPGASKSSRDPKTVDYSPRKRPEKPEITSFDDALESCTAGHGASRSSWDPKTVD